MDPAERRTVETLKSSFKHIATTLDATCMATRAHHNPSSTSTSSSSSTQPNTSLARILKDHHCIRGSALRCLMTALDIDRLAIDKAHRHIALLHGAGQHREAGQAERAVRGYPPLLEVLHVVMEKNGVEEWDRWARRESNAERDEALGRYVPFPFHASDATSPNAQPLPAPISHLLPTLAERQAYDDPLPSPPNSPARILPPLLTPSAARRQVNGQKQQSGGVADGVRSSDSDALLKDAIEADDRAKAQRLAARREVDRRKREEKKRKLAEAEAVDKKSEDAKAGKEERKEDAKEAETTTAKERKVLSSDKARMTIEDEMDAEVQQLASMHDDGAGDVDVLDGGSPSDPTQSARPLRPQLLAGVSPSPTAADASPVNGIDNRDGVSPSSPLVPSLARIDDGLPADYYTAIDFDAVHSPLSLSAPTDPWSTAFSSAGNQHHHTSSSSQSAARPVRNRKKAPRYGEDDLYTPEPQFKPARPSPRKPSDHKPPPPPRSPTLELAVEPVYEIDRLLCFRYRTYPPNHELSGSSYRSFLVAWKQYPRATWVMEEDLVSVDRQSWGS